MTIQKNKKFKEVEEQLSKFCNYREIPEYIVLTPIERIMCYILFNVKNIAADILRKRKVSGYY